jgi:hypothetical protein
MMKTSTSIEGLELRLEELERRVAILERGQKAGEPEQAPQAVIPSSVAVEAGAPGAGFFSVMGKAMLGIAGAYLLRAIAAAHLVPEAVLAPFAIVYALGWLAVAARSARTLARITYACTSVLIIAPMLWELTLRFHVLPAWEDALALAAMVAVPYPLNRAADSTAVLRIASLGVAALALTLATVTHGNLPFLVVLLGMLAMCEFSGAGRKLASVRALLALAADLGVWMLIYVYRTAHPDYPEMSKAALILPGFVLFAIVAASAARQAIVRRERISVFETVQTVIAFLLACCGFLYFGPPGRMALLGAICLMLSFAVYAALFTVMREDADDRNRAVFATWSAVLLIAGSVLFIPAQWRSVWLGLSAVAASAVSTRAGLLFLAVHGNAFLIASAVASGIGAYAWKAMAVSPAGAPAFTVWFLLVSAAACYAVLQGRRASFTQSCSYVPAALACLISAALVASGVVALARVAFEPSSAHLALIRSLTLCVVALALTFGGAAWRRRELTHIAYALVVLEAIKLLAEDLRQGELVYIAASVCLFALTLIAMPRLAKRANTES